MKIQTAIFITSAISALLLVSAILYSIADYLVYFGLFLLVAAGLFLLGLALLSGLMKWEDYQNKREKRIAKQGKRAIISTPHADYTIRSPKRHLVQLTGSPLLEWNGKDTGRELTNVERWAWYTQHAPTKVPDIIDMAPTTPLLPAPTLPNMVKLPDLLRNMQGDLSRLIIGVKLDDSGQLVPVTISIYDLFHTVVAGSSGWGKSIFMGSLLFQMATARESTEFVLIDQQNHGLAPFRNCNRLRYPILQKPSEILSALSEVYQEAILSRSKLFEACDADDLEHYNQLNPDSPLPPVVVAVDEASALLADKEIGGVLKRQAWELRKFGVYQFLMLTSAKGTTIETDHRQQFASKVQLHAADRYQATMLMNAKEATGFPAGRAMIELPGQVSTIVQTPYIDRREIRQLLPNAPTKPPTPLVIEVEETPDAKFRRLVQREGMSKSAASLEAYGRKYAGDIVGKGRKALGELD